MSTAYLTEYEAHLAAVLTPLTEHGVSLYRRPAARDTAMNDVLIPLRPACRIWRVPQATRRWIEQQLKIGASPTADWTLHWDGRWQHLVVSLHYVQAHVLPVAEHPACVAWAAWHAHVMVALMHHGTYDPGTNHEPRPGEELNAIERKTHLQEVFGDCFPWFKTLPKYRLVIDDDGTTHAEEISPYGEDTDNDDTD